MCQNEFKFSVVKVKIFQDQATPNKFLGSHPNFVKNWGEWEVYIFQTALMNRTVLKKTFNTLNLNFHNE